MKKVSRRWRRDGDGWRSTNRPYAARVFPLLDRWAWVGFRSGKPMIGNAGYLTPTTATKLATDWLTSRAVPQPKVKRERRVLL